MVYWCPFLLPVPESPLALRVVLFGLSRCPRSDIHCPRAHAERLYYLVLWSAKAGPKFRGGSFSGLLSETSYFCLVPSAYSWVVSIAVVPWREMSRQSPPLRRACSGSGTKLPVTCVTQAPISNKLVLPLSPFYG